MIVGARNSHKGRTELRGQASLLGGRSSPPLSLTYLSHRIGRDLTLEARELPHEGCQRPPRRLSGEAKITGTLNDSNGTKTSGNASTSVPFPKSDA